MSAPGPHHHAAVPDPPPPAGPADGRSADVAPADARAAVVRQALSVGVATGAYGVSFGALAVASGLAVWQACALSALMFTGGSQFAFIGVVGAGGAPASALAAAAGLGVRNAFYGIDLAGWLPVRGGARVLAAHLTIDESTAVGTSARAGSPALGALGFWATGLSVFVLWNAMTLLGALAGDMLGDPRRWGLDAASSAAFVALLWPRLDAVLPRAIAVSSAAVALGASAVLPAGVPVLVAGAVAGLAGLWPARRGPDGERRPC